MQHIHILGICGTFMGSLAQLAVAKGYRVTGCDANVYPPMSHQLEAAGIELIAGYDPAQLALKPDLIVIGNAMSRGNPLVEAVLEQGLPYVSGPQWLHDTILPGRWVLAVSGTHGKTTTSSMLAWILDYAGMAPGYLIGGVPENFSVSARLGSTPFFVIEADEYDSAFFDKRSKFVHYQPRTLIINNLEFDHADIFQDLQSIQTQFHHLVRTVPANGLVIHPQPNKAVDEVLQRGCWTPQQSFSVGKASALGWSAVPIKADGSEFTVALDGDCQTTVAWSLLGQHNIANGLAAMVAARHVGVTPPVAAAALAEFAGVKRRMECLYDVDGVRVYDDFAHHPTAIATTLAGLRAKVGAETIVAIIEPRSNTMRMGVHQSALVGACTAADQVLWFNPPNLNWDIDAIIAQSSVPMMACDSMDQLIQQVKLTICSPLHIVIMSNGGFDGLHQRLIRELQQETQ